MEAVLAAVISAVVSLCVAFFGLRQSRRDADAKERQLAESVTTELIRQRIGPYTEFMTNLSFGSSKHDMVQEFADTSTTSLGDLMQTAIYGPVGLLATHETRQLILHVRAGCHMYKAGEIEHYAFMLRLWALHLSLRSDLGISQPAWETAVEKVRNSNVHDFSNMAEVIKVYPWERLLVHSTHKLPTGAQGNAIAIRQLLNGTPG